MPARRPKPDFTLDVVLYLGIVLLAALFILWQF
jgi:hypothetical protein